MMVTVLAFSCRGSYCQSLFGWLTYGGSMLDQSTKD